MQEHIQDCAVGSHTQHDTADDSGDKDTGPTINGPIPYQISVAPLARFIGMKISIAILIAASTALCSCTAFSYLVSAQFTVPKNPFDSSEASRVNPYHSPNK